MAKNPGRTTVSATLSRELFDGLHRQAEAEERTVGVVVQRAIREYLGLGMKQPQDNPETAED